MTIISCLATAHQSRETTQAGNPCVCISSFRGSLKEIQPSLHAILPLRNAFPPFLLPFLFKKVFSPTPPRFFFFRPGCLQANTRAELSRDRRTEIYFSLLKRTGKRGESSIKRFLKPLKENPFRGTLASSCNKYWEVRAEFPGLQK